MPTNIVFQSGSKSYNVSSSFIVIHSHRPAHLVLDTYKPYQPHHTPSGRPSVQLFPSSDSENKAHVKELLKLSAYLHREGKPQLVGTMIPPINFLVTHAEGSTVVVDAGGELHSAVLTLWL